MSKQYKMTYNGKKYVTTFSEFGVFCSLCKGCAFDVDGYCNHKNGSQGCNVIKNEDWKSRIWVEDKTAQKKTKDHYWIVEEYIKELNKWHGVGVHSTRWFARNSKSLYLCKTRVRKFVPAK